MLCAPLDWQYMQNCPSQLSMQSCVLCSFVRCGSSNQIEKEKKRHLANQNLGVIVANWRSDVILSHSVKWKIKIK